MNSQYERKLLLRVQKRAETAPSSNAAWHELAIWLILGLFGAGAVALFGRPSLGVLGVIVVAFAAGLLTMLYLAKRTALQQWHMLAPHIDRESIRARLHVLGP